MSRPGVGCLLALLATLSLISTDIFAATISGRITDASNGKPVVFATVRILELQSEAHTDADGHYVFDGVPAGRYTIAVTFAGYSDYAIGVVETKMEGKKTLDAALQPDVAPIYGQDSEPAGMPRDDHGVGDNSTHLGPIRISDMPIRGYEDYVAIQAGTVRRFYGAPVHVRGGRIEEFGYEVDGFPQQDPFTGDVHSPRSTGIQSTASTSIPATATHRTVGWHRDTRKSPRGRHGPPAVHSKQSPTTSTARNPTIIFTLSIYRARSSRRRPAN